jgi:hypothetical protein
MPSSNSAAGGAVDVQQLGLFDLIFPTPRGTTAPVPQGGAARLECRGRRQRIGRNPRPVRRPAREARVRVQREMHEAPSANGPAVTQPVCRTVALSAPESAATRHPTRWPSHRMPPGAAATALAFFAFCTKHLLEPEYGAIPVDARVDVGDRESNMVEARQRVHGGSMPHQRAAGQVRMSAGRGAPRLVAFCSQHARRDWCYEPSIGSPVVRPDPSRSPLGRDVR